MTFASKLADERPLEIAIRDEREALSWTQVDDALSRAVNALLALDLGSDQRLAVFGENAIETGLANIAGLLAGASVVPVNFHLTADEVAYILDDSDARVLFADDKTLERALAAAAASNVHTVVAWRCDPGEGYETWENWLAASDPGTPPSDMRPLPNLLYTSGTTGLPKGTPLPPTMFAGGDTIDAHIEAMRERLALMPQAGTQLLVGPMYHTGPLSSARLLLVGIPSVILGRFDAEKTLQAIEQHRVTSVLMVPTHFVRLLGLPEEVRNRYDVSSLERVSHTGAKCPVDVKRAMIEWFGPVFIDAYGASEVGTTCMITSEEWLEHPGSVGRAIEPFEALILDDDDHALGPNQEGRLFFKDATGRGVVYHNAPEKTAAAHIAPGVFTLGEIGYMDDEGYIYITDRFSDMVVSGGVNIYPAESEHVLIDHPAVADVACIGVPHEEMGEQLKALVIPENPASPPPPEDLLHWCRDRLSHYKCPRSIEYVVDLGRTTMGKINKRKLRAPYWQDIN
jgi:acyl-CoA synthetase (AMP-forming)/AMP-acid ligase II